MYPCDPRPVKEDWSPELLMYKSVPRPVMVEVISASKRDVEIYPSDPRPCVVEAREEPIPITVETKERVEIYPDDPRPCVVEAKSPPDIPPPVVSCTPFI